MATSPTLSTASSSTSSKLLTLVGIVVVIAGLYFGRQVLIPLALAVVFAFLLTPLVSLLEKCRLGRAPAVLAVLVVSFGLLGGAGWIVIGQLAQILEQVPSYKANIHTKMEVLRASRKNNLSKATATVNDLTKELSVTSDAAVKNKAGSAAPPVPVKTTEAPRDAAEYVRDLIGPLTNVLETAGITVLFTLFVLVKREDLRNRVIRLAGTGQLQVMTQALNDGSQRLSRYLLLQFSVNAGYGAVFGLGVYLIGIPHALLWAALAGLLRFVPYIGTPIATLFPMLMALAVFPGWNQVAYTFALFLILELALANFIEPWLYGSHTGVSSLAILVAAIFWGMLWGPMGLILSTPLTVCLIVMGRYIPQLNFLEILLGDEPVLSPQAHFYQRLLALDQDEAKDIADKFLAENSLIHLYDSVMIPALRLAEQDRHTNALDEHRTRFIQQSARELIEEFDAQPLPAESPVSDSATAAKPAMQPQKIFCMPARDEADEIVGHMAVQVLRRHGFEATALSIGTVSSMVEKAALADLICVSALPPYAVAHARSLCKRLRSEYPAVKVVLALWEFQGNIVKAQQRMGANCDAIGTSLEQIVPLIQVTLGISHPPVKGDEETPEGISPSAA